jgi:hypothetical protein
MRTLSILVAAVALIAGLPPPTTPAEEAEAVTDLDAITLGRQVWGPPLSAHDLEGRIVVTYHWCVSCPMSTGAFPYVNGLVAKYAPRGVAFVGFQVRRKPEVALNDVVWYLEHLRPRFPVTRLGWVSEWPAQWLPWAVVFDHTGKRIFADNLRGIEAVLDEALETAPDPVVGGPYEHLKTRVAEIVADRSTTGRHLATARALIADEATPDEVREEARAMVAAAERYAARRTAKAEDLESPVEQAAVHATLAATFAGDALGKAAEERLSKVQAVPNWWSEVGSHRALTAARVAFRKLPPPGQYVYHPTDMNYRVSDSAPLRERRSRMIAEFRLALERIVAEHTNTSAADVASDLLFEHAVPEMDADEAADRLDRARKLILGGRAYGLREARLLLYEIVEGYLATDDVAREADLLLADLTGEREKALVEAATFHATLEAELAAIDRKIRRGGSLLPKKRAWELAAEMEAVAAKAGRDTELARRIAVSAALMMKSYEGRALLGVSFAQDHEGPGVAIAAVSPRTAAAAAGLRPGDVILRFDDEEVESAEALAEYLVLLEPGHTVKVVLRRGGETVTVEVTLGRRL